MHTRILIRLLLAFCLVGLVPGLGLAQAGRGDFDADGLDDLVYVRVDRVEGATSFRIRNSSDPENITRHRFLSAGDAFVTGKFYADGRPYPGIVVVDSATSLLRWVLKNPQGQEETRYYGFPGDHIPNQGDLDCDGKTDLITTRDGALIGRNGHRMWYVDSTYYAQVFEIDFGRTADKVLVGDVTGDGCDELISIHASTFNWSSRGLLSDQVTTVQWGLPGDIPLLPRDINGDDLLDYIVVRAFGDQNVALVRYAEGSSGVFGAGPTLAVPMVGNFFGTGTFGWVESLIATATLLLPSGAPSTFSFGSSDMYVVRPDGTLVSPGEDGRFGNGGGGSPSSCSRRLNPVDGRSRNITYNPANSRRKPKLIMPSNYNSGVQSVSLYQGNRFVASCPRALPNEHGNRPRWYCNIPVSSTPLNVTFVLQLASGNHCVPIRNPRQRYD